MAPTYVKIGRCCNSNEFNGIIIGSDICQNDADKCRSDQDKFQRDEGNGCRASDYLLGGQENGPRGQEDLLLRADCGLQNRDHGLHDADHLHDDGDNGHSRTESSFRRADHILGFEVKLRS